MPRRVRGRELEVVPGIRGGWSRGAVTAVGRHALRDGFARGVARKGFDVKGKRALVVGNGGVGSPIAASLVAGGLAAMAVAAFIGFSTFRYGLRGS